MIRSRTILAVALAGIGFAPLEAFAQRSAGEPEAGSRRGASESGDMGFGLLRIPEVQKDMGLTDAQKVQILTLSMEMRDGQRDMGRKLELVLRPEQLRRLKQIRLQNEGAAALLSAEVSSTLELSPEQLRQLKALRDQVRKAMQQIIEETKGLTPEQRRAKMPEILEVLQKVRTETSEKASDVLTEKQRAKFDELQGPKIDLSGKPRSPAKPTSEPSADSGDSK
jgi:Spy/CpxP family protein refolding chaperone